MTKTRPTVPTIPCPGPCNTPYRRSPAAALWPRIVAEVRVPTDEEWESVIGVAPRVRWGEPVWCEDDGHDVGVAIRRLPELAVAAWTIGHDDPVPVTRMVVERSIDSRPSRGVLAPVAFVERLGCGHVQRVPWSPRPQPALRTCSTCAVHASTSSGRLAPTAPLARKSRSSVIGSPSGSPSWDQVDEVVEWLTSTETWLRGRLGAGTGRSARRRGRYEGRVEVATESMRYLSEHLAQLLALDRGGRVGREALTLASRVERAAGRDRTQRLSTPCPYCDLRTVERLEDGSETVRCRKCKASWRRTEFDYLIRTQDPQSQRSTQ